ncbi:protein kinase [Trypanosoma theileri]|uniref:Protein kinase n=1 Tax=Trypanosoma theileri TaxID=67003 RepID=A0A1X0P6B9_9TRYP|nr:protein kinase [Trypanosoma theileri]ORC92183.1 protein kinase [Trypanosoma theileri]
MDDGTGHLLRPHSIIGMGAYGTVFKAFRLPKTYSDSEEMWRHHAKAVAVKQTILTEVADDITVVLKEVSYLSNLQHHNIVSYYTAFTSHSKSTTPVRATQPPVQKKQKQKQQQQQHKQSSTTKSTQENVNKPSISFAEGPSLCIVEELVEGASVAKVLKMIFAGQIPKPMTEGEIAAVLYDVLEALLYIHNECRLVHRDIKPLNMLLDRNSRSVKLCDFGTCADMSQQAGRYTVIGTIGWIAPEVLDSGMMDHRSGRITSHSFPSDIWSLGVSALEMARPTTRKQALAEYIKDLSAVSCSVQPHVETVRKSFLNEKLPSGDLRDFIACCLRKDPLIRPTVKQLLLHPFIVGNNVANTSERQAKISSILTAVSLASKANANTEEKMNDEGIILPQYASSTLSKNRCMEAIAAIKRDFFAAQASLLEKTRTAHYSWCLPASLTNMLSSNDYRFMPTFSRPQGLGQVPSSSVSSSQTRGSIQLKPLFDSVVLPATEESRGIVLNIMRKYRKLGGAQTADGWTDIDRRSDACYALDELACQNLKLENFMMLYDDLLRTFKAACVSMPDFAMDFMSSFMQSLTSSEDNVQTLQRFIAYIHQLQKDDLMHTHHGQIEPTDSKTTIPKNPSVLSRATHNTMAFAAAEDWLRFPRMPQSAGTIDTTNSGDDTGTDSIRQQTPLVNPSAYLFNKWLKGKQSRSMDSS